MRRASPMQAVPTEYECGFFHRRRCRVEPAGVQTSAVEDQARQRLLAAQRGLNHRGVRHG